MFDTSPVDLTALLYQHVRVTTVDGRTHVGCVYTIDPVSRCIVLVRCPAPPAGSRLQLIMGHAVRDVCIEHACTLEERVLLDRFFQPPDASSAVDVSLRRDRVFGWLESHRIPVELSRRGDGELSVAGGVLCIVAPYRSVDCRSTNAVVLGRIHKLLDCMPTAGVDQG